MTFFGSDPDPAKRFRSSRIRKRNTGSTCIIIQAARPSLLINFLLLPPLLLTAHYSSLSHMYMAVIYINTGTQLVFRIRMDPCFFADPEPAVFWYHLRKKYQQKFYKSYKIKYRISTIVF